MKNIHSQQIPQEIIDQFLQKLNEGHEMIRPYLLQLSNDDRQKLLKMGDKSLALVEKTVELAEANPALCPAYFNMNELKIDFADAVKLRTALNKVQQISRDVEDTMMTAGNEALSQSLTFYNSVKQAVRDKISGAVAIYEELSKRFVTGRPRKKSSI